jgi:hypothetical protein
LREGRNDCLQKDERDERPAHRDHLKYAAAGDSCEVSFRLFADIQQHANGGERQEQR